MAAGRPPLTSCLNLPARQKSGNGNSFPSNGGESKRESSKSSIMSENVNWGLVLRTTVVKGRNLAAKDRSGTSDPYLVLTLGDSREATPAISKSLNPEWNQTLDLPITGVQSLLLEVVCWDRDLFGKDYMGELDISLEEIFSNSKVTHEATWYSLGSRKLGKKESLVTGEVLLQFTLIEPSNPSSTTENVVRKLLGLIQDTQIPYDDDDERMDNANADEDDEQGSLEETDEPNKIDAVERRRRRLRIARLKRNAIQRGYEFSGNSHVAGILFLEVSKITDLPSEKNVTRTSFDMDPFVVISLGKKTYRTRVIRHNLNPVFEEKLVFQVMRHETNYSVNFAVVDHDKLSGNDFVGTANLGLGKVTSMAPEADPASGLYRSPSPPDPTSSYSEARRSRFRLAMSRSSSANSLTRVGKSGLRKQPSQTTIGLAASPNLSGSNSGNSSSSNSRSVSSPFIGSQSDPQVSDDLDKTSFALPLDMKNRERWEAKHSPILYIRAKYLPYKALRQQFWRAMLKQYDADDSGQIDRVELTTMLDSLGSTLHESTIDGFFSRYINENNREEGFLTMDQAVLCLEEQLEHADKKSQGFTSNGFVREPPYSAGAPCMKENSMSMSTQKPTSRPLLSKKPSSKLKKESHGVASVKKYPRLGKESEEGSALDKDDLADGKNEEHVVEIRECPICHQPRLNKKSDADIITHVATCASQDWRQVNNIVMGGFVTSSQAQRKWYSKVITKVTYGGYKLGANSANILVQDRTTGQISEERMSVYVRLGIRLLYKGLKSRDMEKKRIRRLLKSLSIKQGKKYDDPASTAEIRSFINFHQLDMSEVLLPIDRFKSFNEFFYRALKADARPCSAPNDPNIITAPADCRSVVFNRIDDAQKIWVKGREFSIERLFGKAYAEDSTRYKGGSLGVFRLAPQDYHRFHIPIDGVLGEPKTIEGDYYTVNPMAIRSALDVYGENVRVLVPIDSLRHGRVMIICVGAMMVGSTVIVRNKGERVMRAEELGYFKFGGSTLLVLFEPGVMQFDHDLTENSKGALETLIRVGMSIGHESRP